MATQTINQKKAVELLRGGQSVSDYEIHFNDDQVEALDAFLLRKNGIAIPDHLVFYDDESLDFEDDADIAYDPDFDDVEWKRVPFKMSWEEKVQLAEKMANGREAEAEISIEMNMQDLPAKIFALSEDIRYVAVYADGQLTTAERPGIPNTSGSESDKYEELIVNPTLLKLVTQRGNIDCGGVEYVLIRYGYFYALVMPAPQGHITVGIEPEADLMMSVETVRACVREWATAA